MFPTGLWHGSSISGPWHYWKVLEPLGGHPYGRKLGHCVCVGKGVDIPLKEIEVCRSCVSFASW